MAITLSSASITAAIGGFLRPGGALLALSLVAASAHAVDVTVAYQTSAEPAKVAQADNSFAKLSGANVDWRKFDSGSK